MRLTAESPAPPSGEIRRYWVYVTGNLVLGGGDQILLMHARALRDSPFRMAVFSLEPMVPGNPLVDEMRSLGVEFRDTTRFERLAYSLVFAATVMVAGCLTMLRVAARGVRRLIQRPFVDRSRLDERIWFSELNSLRERVMVAERALLGRSLARRLGRFCAVNVAAGIHVMHAAACQALGTRFDNAGVPMVYTEILTPASSRNHSSELKSVLARYAEIIVPAGAIARQLEKILGIAGPFRVIPFVTPISNLDVHARFWPDRFNIGVIARLSEEKGHRYLIEAMPEILKRCPKARLLLAGDGPERSALERMARATNVFDRCEFLGAFRPSELSRVMDEIDVVALPSRIEGMPHALVEAMAFGKPIVATPVGAVSELVEEGRSGYLVPTGDVPSLAKQITLLLNDAELRREMGLRGRELFKLKYDCDYVLSSIRKLVADHDQEKPPCAALSCDREL